MAAGWVKAHAQCSGVHPNGVRRSMSQDRDMSSCMCCRSPWAEARHRSSMPRPMRISGIQ